MAKNECTLNVSVLIDEKNLKRVEAIAKNLVEIQKLLKKNLRLKALNKKDENIVRILDLFNLTSTRLSNILERLIKPVQTR
jgi:hypothetical protein